MLSHTEYSVEAMREERSWRTLELWEDSFVREGLCGRESRRAESSLRRSAGRVRCEAEN